MSTCNSCNTCDSCSTRNACGCNSCGCNSCDSCNSCNNRSGCNSCDSCDGCNSCNSCDGCNSCLNWNGFFPPFGCWFPGDWWRCNCDCEDDCPFSRWRHPIQWHPAFFCDAGSSNGGTLVIHKIVLEAGGQQSCTPRSFHIRITGPSYPCGEIFTLRAGSCLELDEPLVISGLEPGEYQIEELHDCPRDFLSTITGPVCGRCVRVSASIAPTVITIVSRRRVCRRLRSSSCGCGF